MKTGSVVPFTTAVVLALFANSVCAAGTYSGGTGEPNDPYRIATANDLNDIGNHVEDFNKCFILMNDINLADYTGTQFNIIGSESNPFMGVFDGNDNKTLNFTWNSIQDYNFGLFAYLGTGGRINNLGMENVDIHATSSGSVTGGIFVGALVGISYKGTINNCSSTGSIIGGGRDNVGGLVGKASLSTISNCYVTSDVSGGVVGGIVAFFYGGTILNCYVTSDVSGDGAGGLFWAGGGTISDCYTTGNVSGSYRVGGLAGLCYECTFSNCYTTGSVSGDFAAVGGLVGYNMECTMSNCYATGSISGGETLIGGLVGWHKAGTISNCYATGSVSGDQSIGGIAGDIYRHSFCFFLGYRDWWA